MNQESIEYPAAKHLISSGLMLPSTAKFNDLVRVMYRDALNSIIIIDSDSNEYFLITEKDIIQFLYHRQKSLQTRLDQGRIRDNIPLKDLFDVELKYLMKGPLEIVDEDLPLDQIITMMHNQGADRILLGKDEQPSGIITLNDILAWNNRYFKQSTPIMLMIMDNSSGIILGRYDFSNHFNDGHHLALIDLYGAALQSIGHITEEIFQSSGEMRVLEKDNYTVLFEPREKVTAIIICTNSSIDIRRRLIRFIDKFCKKYEKMLSIEGKAKLMRFEVKIQDLAKDF